MGADQCVELVRQVLTEAMILSAPLLVTVGGVSVVMSFVQTLTSIQEQTLTTVPRLVAAFIVTMITLPWMIHHLIKFTESLFRDFNKYLG